MIVTRDLHELYTPIASNKRLFLFSGGVESTRLIMDVNDTDLVITFAGWEAEPGGSNRAVETSYNRNHVDEIIKRFNIKNHRYIQMPNLNVIRNEYYTPLHRHQISHFTPLLITFLSIYQNQFNEVRRGGCLEDLPRSVDNTMKEVYWRQTLAMKIINNVPMTAPLCHIMKREQFMTIPEDVRPYVQTCNELLRANAPAGTPACGECFKCEERIKCNVPLEGHPYESV